MSWFFSIFVLYCKKQRRMTDYVKHIFEHFKPGDFNLNEVGTRFQYNTLVIYYREYYMSIERFFYITKTSKYVTLDDFKGNIV